MKTLFNFFEELDEMVYVSDIETHELIYLNRHLRENLGFLNNESYKGKKCYEVLQKRNSPCPFCNNNELRTEKFFTWIHENPVLKQKFVIKDKMFFYNNSKYHIQIAIKASENDIVQTTYFYTHIEAILNKCLQCFFATPDPEESIDMLLAYLGKVFNSDRVYIFEFYSNQTASNTYEWCNSKILPQKDILQKIPNSDIGYWMDRFEQKQSVIIADLEDIRTIYPSTYSLLHPQEIKSLCVAPIFGDGLLKGFIGIDNPERNSFILLEKVLTTLSGSIGVQFKRRNLYKRFNEMSYRDSLTGAYNRNAMVEHNLETKNFFSFGAVYCDINGLKETNDTQGHLSGNKLIQECYHILEKTLDTKLIYRIGGDEFVALYYNVEKEKIEKDIDNLRLAIMQSDCQISIGYSWSNTLPIDTEEIMHKADMLMYEEKEIYYKNLKTMLEDSKERNNISNIFIMQSEQKLQKFLSNTYFDISFLFSTLSDDNETSYLFFGDIQKNLFYISDNMREKFGFKSNIISDFINKWSARIEDSHLLNRFWSDINNILDQKQSYHDLRYPILDTQGNYIWVRCYGKIKWNEDKTKPLFFAGRVTHQDTDFIVDSLTNFPTETVLIKHLKHSKENNRKFQAIGFSLNNITQINNNHGRNYGDNLIHQICQNLYANLSGKVTFYRLSGMRCLALIDSRPLDETKAIILQIKEIIEDCYQRMGVSLQYPCSFALLSYPQEGESIQDFVENILALIKLAKQEPKQLYIDNSNGDIQKIQNLSNMELRLIQDILNNMENFRIVIQPVVSTVDNNPVGGETLLRWRFEGKEISPAVFIPIIEKENMIHLIGRWVFEQAVRSCVRILSYCPDFYLTVNASLQQLNDEGFIDFMKQALEKYNLDGKHIVVEMTESCMDEQPEKLLNFVKACENMNIKIALDDFGSGYSSLRVLLQYPSSIIKLDRSLLLEMSDSFEKNNFITSIVYACHQFGKKVCMEGVETEFQNELVKEAGCDMIQGYLYYRPMEVNQVYKLLADKFES